MLLGGRCAVIDLFDTRNMQIDELKSVIIAKLIKAMLD